MILKQNKNHFCCTYFKGKFEYFYLTVNVHLNYAFELNYLAYLLNANNLLQRSIIIIVKVQSQFLQNEEKP